MQYFFPFQCQRFLVSCYYKHAKNMSYNWEKERKCSFIPSLYCNQFEVLMINANC